MNEVAERVFDHLKGKDKLSGGQVRSDLDLSKKEWTEAKDELKALRLVELGRGRGGTIRLISENKPAPKKEPSKAERMAFAREAKQATTKVQKVREKMKEKAEELVQKEFPGVKHWIEPLNIETGECIVYVRDEDIPGWQPYRCHV